MNEYEVRELIKSKFTTLLVNNHVCKMKEFMQHGTVDTYSHCLNVAVISYIIALKLGEKKFDINAMLTGAILHDFYLYDWHEGRKRVEGIHGFTHPKTALKNATTYFELTNKEKNIIESHMFPLTITKVPKSKEAFIVCCADKICAIREYSSSLFYGKRILTKY